MLWECVCGVERSVHLHRLHRALCLFAAICARSGACPVRATDLTPSLPSSMLSDFGRKWWSSEVDGGVQCELPCRLSRLWLGLIGKQTGQMFAALHSERLAIFGGLFPDSRALHWPLVGQSFSRFSTSLGEGRGFMLTEGWLCARPCALHVILFKPHRALPWVNWGSEGCKSHKVPQQARGRAGVQSLDSPLFTRHSYFSYWDFFLPFSPLCCMIWGHSLSSSQEIK